MNQFAKFTLKTFKKPAPANPVENRRAKLIAAIAVQKLVLAAAIKGEAYVQITKKGERAVRAWFAASDGGYFVQARYGARALLLDGTSDAVFVAKLADVAGVLAAFEAAAAAGDLDAAIASVAERRRR